MAKDMEKDPNPIPNHLLGIKVGDHHHTTHEKDLNNKNGTDPVRHTVKAIAIALGGIISVETIGPHKENGIKADISLPIN